MLAYPGPRPHCFSTSRLTCSIGAVVLPNCLLGVFVGLVGHISHALGPSGTVVDQLELSDGTDLFEQALFVAGQHVTVAKM